MNVSKNLFRERCCCCYSLSLSLSLSVLFRALVFENEEDEIGVFGKIRFRKKERGEQISAIYTYNISLLSRSFCLLKSTA